MNFTEIDAISLGLIGCSIIGRIIITKIEQKQLQEALNAPQAAPAGERCTILDDFFEQMAAGTLPHQLNERKRLR